MGIRSKKYDAKADRPSAQLATQLAKSGKRPEAKDKFARVKIPEELFFLFGGKPVKTRRD